MLRRDRGRRLRGRLRELRARSGRGEVPARRRTRRDRGVHGGGPRSRREHCLSAPRASCAFEYIYFSRPDSVVDGVSVHAARLRAGRILAEEHPVDADVVVGVPDSGLDAALGYARASGVEWGMGLVRNRYVGRTFISPGKARAWTRCVSGCLR